jgi:hypothetical protein
MSDLGGLSRHLGERTSAIPTMPSALGSRRDPDDLALGVGRKRRKRDLIRNMLEHWRCGNGSDGTRTRDLRRDRPVMVVPG